MRSTRAARGGASDTVFPETLWTIRQLRKRAKPLGYSRRRRDARLWPERMFDEHNGLMQAEFKNAYFVNWSPLRRAVLSENPEDASPAPPIGFNVDQSQGS